MFLFMPAHPHKFKSAMCNASNLLHMQLCETMAKTYATMLHRGQPNMQIDESVRNKADKSFYIRPKIDFGM